MGTHFLRPISSPFFHPSSSQKSVLEAVVCFSVPHGGRTCSQNEPTILTTKLEEAASTISLQKRHAYDAYANGEPLFSLLYEGALNHSSSFLASIISNLFLIPPAAWRLIPLLVYDTAVFCVLNQSFLLTFRVNHDSVVSLGCRTLCN